jgi:hypothetical protein
MSKPILQFNCRELFQGSVDANPRSLALKKETKIEKKGKTEKQVQQDVLYVGTFGSEIWRVILDFNTNTA